MPNNYVPLQKLIYEWSRQSGELEEVVLTNLCDQDARGKLPSGTFRDIGTGGAAEPGMLADLVRLVRSSGYDWVRVDAAEDLACVAVSKAGVLAYCKEHGVRPPQCVTGFWRWWFWHKAQHSGPPPYPSTPEEIAAERIETERQEALAQAHHDAMLETQAEAQLSHMEMVLGAVANQIQRGEKVVFDKGLGDIEAGAQNYIDQLTGTRRADALTARLKELQSQATALRAQAEEDAQPRRETEAAGTGTKTGQTERPTVAAETKAWRYMEKQVRAGTWKLKKQLFQEALKVCGPGLSKRGFERVWSEVVPAEWRKPGRPKAH